ncbi:MAG: hypothetical protein IAF58_18210 [Leptolyngbya sp.]|nr:hypothetical protein [Candidatus Melainabacteria bacterium]
MNQYFQLSNLTALSGSPRQNIMQQNAPAALSYKRGDNGMIVGASGEEMWHVIFESNNVELHRISSTMTLSFAPEDGSTCVYSANKLRLPIN